MRVVAPVVDLDTLPVIASPHHYDGRRRAIRLAVVHTPEAPERFDGAEALGRYFQGTRRASTHAGVDADSIVRYVEDADTAFGAENANADGLHAELVGYAEQSPEEWADDFSTRTVANAAGLFRSWCDRHGLPKRHLTIEEIRAGHAGIAGHHDVYLALGGTAVRTDPGPNFPWGLFLELVNDGQHHQEDDDVKEELWRVPGSGTVWLVGADSRVAITDYSQVHELAKKGRLDHHEATLVSPRTLALYPDRRALARRILRPEPRTKGLATTS